ncbi:hypothetical protein [Candidatus Magnetominusculus dajiuhuensis]|uniref:hypothetical protein n=1 Tax=Candidatus Magnetominusculus dajiuhuensis TaxID=3137712 RepID=UPI003B427F70
MARVRVIIRAVERIKKHVKVVPLGAAASDCQYWRSRPMSERLEAIEMLRKQYYGDITPGLQRVCRIINRQKG